MSRKSTLKPAKNLAQLYHFELAKLSLSQLFHIDTSKACSSWLLAEVQSNKISGYLYYPSRLYLYGLQPCTGKA